MKNIKEKKIFNCPECNYIMKQTKNIDGEIIEPEPLDIAVCPNCGEILEFDDKLNLKSSLNISNISIENRYKLLRIQIMIKDRGRLVSKKI